MKRTSLLVTTLFCMAFSAGAQIVTNDTALTAEPASKWTVSVFGGYTHRVGKVDDSGGAAATKELKKLKNGINYGAEICNYFQDYIGVGVLASNFLATNSVENVNIFFAGPVFNMRYSGPRNNNMFNAGLGVGYMGYRDVYKEDHDIFISGGAPGFQYSFGYDLALSHNLYLGGVFRMFEGSLSSYKTHNHGSVSKTVLDEGKAESLNHIDLSICLKWLF